KPLHPYITKAKVSAFIDFYRQKKALEKAHKYVLSLNQQLEERVEERTEELSRKNRDLDNFIYTASHDLKAPISNIEGLMQLLYKTICDASADTDKVNSIQQMINASIDRFKKTLKELTEVAKVQNADVLDATELHFSELLAEVKSDIASDIAQSGALLETDFTKAPSIVYSRKNLRSILYNLISNAIKYRSPDRKPVVKVSSWSEDGNVVLEVKDNGLGIAREDQDKVYGMFKRLHTHVEGSGVGMAIVKRIIENSGSSIVIESDEGAGTSFIIHFKQ
ncbi:MAG: HAMP domain-containing histidine kinase, partial [Bacteroidetes bacterium]|nr:HAMP domain-containing histidine kinase [Bacteroidota bacterium]